MVKDNITIKPQKYRERFEAELGRDTLNKMNFGARVNEFTIQKVPMVRSRLKPKKANGRITFYMVMERK